MSRRGRDQNLPVILVSLLVTGAAFAGLVAYGHSLRARAAQPPSSRPPFEPVVFLPDLKVGDVVAVDPVEAMMPAQLRALPLVLCTVDLILSDRQLVSVRANVHDFKGTIPRTAIKQVLPVPRPGDFA